MTRCCSSISARRRSTCSPISPAGTCRRTRRWSSRSSTAELGVSKEGKGWDLPARWAGRAGHSSRAEHRYPHAATIRYPVEQGPASRSGLSIDLTHRFLERDQESQLYLAEPQSRRGRESPMVVVGRLQGEATTHRHVEAETEVGA